MKLLAILLLLPLTAFGTITVTDKGTGSDNASNSSVVINGSVMGSSMAAGSTGIITLAMDNATASATNLTNTASYTDSVGNVWYVRLDSFGTTANGSSELVVLTSILTNAFTTGSTLTISLNAASVAEAWTITEAAPTAGNIVLFNQQNNNTTAGTQTPTITSIEVANGDLIFGCGSGESADIWTGVASPWSTKQSVGAGTGAAGMSAISQWQISSAYGTKVFNPTLSALTDTKLCWMIFTEADAKARTMATNTTSSTTITMTFTNPLASGSLGVLCISLDNNGSAGSVTQLASSMTDSKGNTWTRRMNPLFDNGIAGAGIEGGIYTAPIGSGGGAAIVIGDTVAQTVGVAVTAKSWTVWEFAPAAAGTVTYVTGSTGTGNTNGTPTVTTSSIPSGDYVIGLCAAEALNDFVGATYSTNGTWKRQCAGGVGATAANGSAITSQWKLTTGAGAQTYDPTMTSADWVTAWIELNDSSVLGPTAAQKAAFFLLFP